MSTQYLSHWQSIQRKRYPPGVTWMSRSKDFPGLIPQVLTSRHSRRVFLMMQRNICEADVLIAVMIRLRKDLTLSNMDASMFSSQDYHGEIIRNIQHLPQ
jgi:hypothetical protein